NRRHGSPTVSVPGKVSALEYRNLLRQSFDPRTLQTDLDWTEIMQGRILRMLSQAVRRRTIEFPWPTWKSLVWDEAREQYQEKLAPHSKDNIEAAGLRYLGDLILKHGRLIMACKAPAPRKRGRTAPGAKKEPGQVCGKLFLPERVSGDYCSDTCRNRV